MTRKIQTVVMLLTICALWTSCLWAAPLPTGERLRVLAERIGFHVGGASVSQFWQKEPDYQEVFAREYNMLTPENDLKWHVIHPQPNVYNWNDADQHIRFAESHQMVIHGHTLLWFASNPDWVSGVSNLQEETRRHVQTVVGRYQGRIAVWDVVNEAISDRDNPGDPYDLRQNIWYTKIGPNYLDLAFQDAHAADPKAILICNDYGIETVNRKSTALHDVIQAMLARGVPIHGVGFQMHLKSDGLDYQSLAQNLKRFAALGLKLYITEFDVRLQNGAPEELQKQAAVYQYVLKACLDEPACQSVQMWGLLDKYSWIPQYYPGYGWALPFDDQYSAKPAYYALQSELEAVMPPPTPTPTPIPIVPEPSTIGLFGIALGGLWLLRKRIYKQSL